MEIPVIVMSAVDPADLERDLLGDDLLVERGLGFGERDRRSVGEVMARQIETADLLAVATLPERTPRSLLDHLVGDVPDRTPLHLLNAEVFARRRPRDLPAHRGSASGRPHRRPRPRRRVDAGPALAPRVPSGPAARRGGPAGRFRPAGPRLLLASDAARRPLRLGRRGRAARHRRPRPLAEHPVDAIGRHRRRPRSGAHRRRLRHRPRRRPRAHRHRVLARPGRRSTTNGSAPAPTTRPRPPA